MTKEERIQKAVALFKEGYNCSQSVVGAYADMYGFTFEQALHMAASFGGGIGRMREICGAACGMFCWQVWNAVQWKGQTGKERLPIINWCRNWLKSLRKNVVLFIAVNCWACQRKNLLWLHPMPGPHNIMPNVRVHEWWKRQQEFGAISWKMKGNCNKKLFFRL